MSAVRTFAKLRFVILLYILGLASLMSGQAAAQESFVPPKDVAIPATEGVYVLESGSYTRLTDHSTGADAEDVRHRTFSKDMSILVFGKWVADPAQDINSIAILDWRSIGEHPMLQLFATTKPVAGHQDMFVILPEQPMKPGLYTVQIGNKSHEWCFGVETPDIAAYWNSVLNERPNNWQAHNHLGAILYMKNDVKGAYPHFLKAVQLNPRNCESHNNLGLTLSMQGDLNGAIEQYQDALKIKDDSAIETNLANAYLQVKRYDDAITTYKHAIQLCPENASAHCNLGYALMQQGKLDDAIVEFRETVKLDPTMPQGKADLEQALRMKDNKP